MAAAGVGQVAVLLILLAAVYVPLGDWMARTYTSSHDTRAEKLVYRMLGVNPAAGQTWKGYARAVLAFSVASLVVLYAIQRLQAILPSLGTDQEAVGPAMAFNTAASFVTNTNWQSYSGESTLTNLTQMTGLTVQNFVSAAVGMAVAAALVRGIGHLGHRQADPDAAAHAPGGHATIGNFWVDLVRGLTRILVPGAFLIAVLLVIGGTMQSFGQNLTTVFGVDVPRAPVASQEAIKELGTNGGGIFGANSAHPFENPTALTNILEIFALLVIPVALTRTYGTMIGSRRDGLTLLGVIGVLWGLMLAGVTWAQHTASAPVAAAAGANMEGIESRFGINASSLFAVSTTGTSTGAVNSMHDSYSPLGGGLLILNMLLGEVAPGGVGAGLYGLLVLAILAVFVGGLLVGRTPEFAGNRVGRREITAVCLYILVMPTLVLAGTAASLARGDVAEAMTNVGAAGTAQNAHGLSEVLYAYTSAANNNGSAFGGLTVTDTWFQVTLGLTMLIGRFLPILFVLMLAGSFAAQKRTEASTGTLPTHGATFAMLTLGVVVLVAALTFFPALCLGPISEALA
ncbi:potassium-transporting ATPase subunit KdpA [Corynebacterium sp. 335C]